MKAIANKTLRFGMVSLPVGLCQAVEKGSDITFNQAGPNGETLRQAYLDPEGNEVPRDKMLKGIREGSEFHAIAPEAIDAIKERTDRPDMEIIDTIQRADIPADRINEKYFIQSHPKTGNASAFKLLVDALDAEDIALVVKTTIKSRLHLIALEADDGILVGHGLNYANDMRAPDAAVEAHKDASYSDAEFDMAKQMLEVMGQGRNGDPLNDEIDDLRPLKAELVAKASQGQAIEVPEAATPATPDTSLTDALAASIEAAKKDKVAA